MRKVEWLVTEAETESGRPSKRGKKKIKAVAFVHHHTCSEKKHGKPGSAV